MLTEFAAESLNRQDVQDLIQKLVQQEGIIESNRGRDGDRDRLHAAENLRIDCGKPFYKQLIPVLFIT